MVFHREVIGRGRGYRRDRRVGQTERKTIEFTVTITDDAFRLLKYHGKLQLVGFSYNKKCTNVVMWKDEEYEYICVK